MPDTFTPTVTVDHIEEALRNLRRAASCEHLGWLRNDFLGAAITSLEAAGLPEYAARIDAAAEPFGGGWADAEMVERELSERRGG